MANPRGCKEISGMGSVTIESNFPNRPFSRAKGGVITLTVGKQAIYRHQLWEHTEDERGTEFPQP